MTVETPRAFPPHLSLQAHRGAAGLGADQAGPQNVSSSPTSADQLTFLNEYAEPYVQVSSSEVMALGQLHHTYLVVQVGSSLTILDQHTVHERVLFERLYRAWVARGMASQPLLIPESVELSAPQAALLQRYQSDLEKLGLELEPFGMAAVLVRSVPLGIGAINAPAFLQDLLEDLSLWGQASSLEERVRPVLASLACHSAVRAGRLRGLPVFIDHRLINRVEGRERTVIRARVLDFSNALFAMGFLTAIYVDLLPRFRITCQTD